MAEHAEMLARHGIDYADALDRFGGNGALYERLARKYAEDPHFDRLVRALGEGDAAAAYHEAHSLKGVAGNLSFADLHQAAAPTKTRSPRCASWQKVDVPRPRAATGLSRSSQFLAQFFGQDGQ